MSLLRIRNILNTKMAALSGGLRIAWENVPFEPNPNESHYRVNFLPTPTRAAANHRSAMNFESGIYQIDIYTPQNRGTGAPDALAESVRTHFARGLKLTDDNGVSVHIQSTPSLIRSVREGAFYRLQMDVYWFAYTPTS